MGASDNTVTGTGTYAITGESFESSPASLSIEDSTDPVHFSRKNQSATSRQLIYAWFHENLSSGAGVYCEARLGFLDQDDTDENADRYDVRYQKTRLSDNYEVYVYRYSSGSGTLIASVENYDLPSGIGVDDPFWIIATCQVIGGKTYIRAEAAATKAGARDLVLDFEDDTGDQLTTAGVMRYGGYVSQAASGRQMHLDSLSFNRLD